MASNLPERIKARLAAFTVHLRGMSEAELLGQVAACQLEARVLNVMGDMALDELEERIVGEGIPNEQPETEGVE